MNALTVNIGEVTHNLTMKVRGQKRFAARSWLACQLIRLAAFVIGTKLSIELLSGDDFDEQELPTAFDGSPYRRYVKVGDYVVPSAASVREGPLYESSFTEWGPHVDVLLDGVKQNEVVSFDMDSGWIRRNRKNAEGSAYIAGDEIATEVLRGTVELRPRQ
jgi:hypothetical protein